jgi:hypothetical protein
VVSLLTSVTPSASVFALRPADRDPARGDAAHAPGAEPAPRDRVTISREARSRLGDELTPEQRREVQELQARDAHVRAHEAAHQAAGGALSGGASFTFQMGPDGRSYAVGGEVPIRMEQGGTGDETIENARQVRRAALAPADPSPQDLSIAAQAMSMEQAAQSRKAREASRAYGRTGQAGGGATGRADEAAGHGGTEQVPAEVA